ncbi:MAG TPA: hypothetical protein VK530_11975 [Candidatus Acidoferrum sp.]|nr:hypothetical protein [Candidatus Acidoferrum sp.]
MSTETNVEALCPNCGGNLTFPSSHPYERAVCLNCVHELTFDEVESEASTSASSTFAQLSATAWARRMALAAIVLMLGYAFGYLFGGIALAIILLAHFPRSRRNRFVTNDHHRNSAEASQHTPAL